VTSWSFEYLDTNSEGEVAGMSQAQEETQHVMREWEEHGGLWVGGEAEKRWIGVEEPVET
jgi:hypothetical protein